LDEKKSQTSLPLSQQKLPAPFPKIILVPA
jgi:hypothetical protein